MGVLDPIAQSSIGSSEILSLVIMITDRLSNPAHRKLLTTCSIIGLPFKLNNTFPGNLVDDIRA
jgi:hypothetical protein